MTPTERPDPREWAKKLLDAHPVELPCWAMNNHLCREGCSYCDAIRKIEKEIGELISACYRYAAAVAREHDCESGNSWCPCRVAEQLDRLAAEIERGE